MLQPQLSEPFKSENLFKSTSLSLIVSKLGKKAGCHRELYYLIPTINFSPFQSKSFAEE